MPIFKGSRYEGVEYTGIIGKDGIVRKFLHQRVPVSESDITTDVVVHTVDVTEELDQLAHRFAIKPLLWWLIADVNNIMFPLEIEPGSLLLIPVQELRERREP